MRQRPVAMQAERMLVGSEIVPGHAVLVRDGRIQAVVRSGAIPSDYDSVPLPPGLLAPGFVDIHAHGAGGRGFNESDPDAHRHALRYFLDSGTTTILPTLSAAPIDDMTAAIQAFAGVGAGGGPRTPGMHLEGPYFSQEQRGAQDPASLRSPEDGSIEQILEYADAISMISFAPELPGAVALTERLVGLSIIAAAGHSDGRDTDLLACQRAGLSHVIHIVSGQSTTRREGPWRQPGMLEATLASENLTVEMIADGKHLPPTLMRMAYRCLAGRLCLVSDAVSGTGLPDGQYFTLGNERYVVKNRVGMTLDNASFAGSVTFVSEMVPIARRTLDVSIPDAIAMATSIPAKAARLDDIGAIAPGYHADFVLLDADLNVRDTALAGVWQSGAGAGHAGLSRG